MRAFSRRRLLAAAGLWAGCGFPQRETRPEARPEDAELLATFYPTPLPVVRLMLQLSELRAGELHFDLGSGDGRIVLTAAGELGARSVGFEIDEELVSQSRRSIIEAGLSDRAEIRRQDLLLADYSEPDVITTFLTPEGLEKVVPRLERTLTAGARLVAYKFPLPGWTPVRVEELVDEDPEVPLHEVFLYRWG